MTNKIPSWLFPQLNLPFSTCDTLISQNIWDQYRTASHTSQAQQTSASGRRKLPFPQFSSIPESAFQERLSLADTQMHVRMRTHTPTPCPKSSMNILAGPSYAFETTFILGVKYKSWELHLILSLAMRYFSLGKLLGSCQRGTIQHQFYNAFCK